jgi:hypothetical protein
MSLSSNSTNIPSNEHIILLYNNENDRNNAAVNYINKGLKMDIIVFMHLSMHMIVKVALIFQTCLLA